MNANRFKTAIAQMSETQTNEVISALGRARDHAMELMRAARLPECAAFGAIARDLDCSLSIIRGQAEADQAPTPIARVA